MQPREFITNKIDFRQKISLMNADAFSILPTIPKESIDLIVTSPPYCMGKEYESTTSLNEFRLAHSALIDDIVNVLKPGGSIAWQVGTHVKDGIVTPLDFEVHNIFSKNSKLLLRNRIVWTFGHGEHCTKRFSGRHETILWYTKGKDYKFNLDAVRVPQKYPGKRYYKGPNKGAVSSHSLGKNPSDVWDMPNVKFKHIEKTEHPCQFPVALAERLIKAVCPNDGIILDPFLGSGSTALAAILCNKRFLGMDTSFKYCKLTEKRINDFLDGKIAVRDESPPQKPNTNYAVAKPILQPKP